MEVEIFTGHKGLAQIPECQPRPAHQFFPEWFKEVPKHPEKGKGTIKNCPVFAEYLTQGFVIPMWCDTVIRNQGEGVEIHSSMNEFRWEVHPNFQYLDYLPEHARDRNYLTLKALCPWYIRTPPGYSVYQSDMYYHFNTDFTILPGTINTDYHRQINQQVLVDQDREIFIPRGAPFAWYIPYKREKYNYTTRIATEEDELDILRSESDTRSKFTGSYMYRKRNTDD